ncbi:MAG: preprotein translocase subunit SecA, partial [Bacteroidia bacterium]
QHQREADIVQEAGQPGSITLATNMAGRGTDIKLGKGVKEAGGLAIIGTERHDSRRVDRQLRGRAGRQGDPGSSQFFVSLEDNLMRLFGSDRVSKVMDKFGYEEGEVIQHSMISKTIERSQKKVEQNNFGIRKRLLEYDDVMNKQRVVIYSRRRNALYGDRLSLDINNALYDWVEETVASFKDTNDYDGFKMEVLRHVAVDPSMTQGDFTAAKSPELTQQIFDMMLSAYERKNNDIIERALVVFKNIHNDRGQEVKNILVPFSDGKKAINVSVNLEKAITTEGREIINSFERYVALASIDEHWKEHLRELDDLKQTSNNASIEQKDPLLIYKLESFNLFQSMIGTLNA